MSESINAALAFLAASYATSEPEMSPIAKMALAETATRKKRTTKLVKQTSLLNGKESAPVIPETIAPEVQVARAKAFLIALPHCGKGQNDKGVFCYLGDSKKRDDEKIAIKDFTGSYNPAEPHGFQLDTARQQAHTIIKPAKATEYSRGVAATVAGYVAGLPDMVQSKVDDLLARERISAKQIVTYQNALLTMREGTLEHNLHTGLLAVEEQRVNAIRKDLENLGAL